MSREIITGRDIEDSRMRREAKGGGSPRGGSGNVVPRGGGASGQSGAERTQPDEYKDRLIKYIPTEIVTLYLSVLGVLAAATDLPTERASILKWAVFAVMLVLTYLYQRFSLNIKKIEQLIIGVISFAVWAFTLPPGPFHDLKWYNPIYGALLLPIYTFAIALYKPESK